MKLGELLIRDGMINEEQLQEALNSQLIHGGHLGTCLIEQGSLTEEQLGKVLARTFQVPCAPPDSFDNIPRHLIATLPAEMVEKFHAVPFQGEGSRIDVAMLDPSDLQAIDTLAFAAGRRVRPWVAPEVRLLQAMDRYYGIARRMRYITLARQLDKQADETAATTGRRIAPAGPAQPASEVTWAMGNSRAWTQAGADAAAADGANRETPAASTVAVADTDDAVSMGSGKDPLEPVAGLLCRVAAPAKLGEIVLDFAEESLARSILFDVKACCAVPWAWRGFTIAAEQVPHVRFPITGEPLFSLMLGEGFYRGPVPGDARFDGFYKALGLSRPKEFVLVPAYADDRLVALFYGDDGDGMGIAEQTATFCRLGRKLGLALNLITIKQQIRTV